MRKIKVLYLIGGFGVGGKERQLAELIKGLNKSEFEICLIIKSDGAHYINYIKDLDIEFIDLKTNHLRLRAFLEIKRHIDRISPDIVHSWASITSIFAVIIQKVFFKKFVFIDGIRQANPISSQVLFERIVRSCIRKYSCYIVSNSSAGHTAYKTPPEKSILISNGFDFNRIHKLKQKDSLITEFNVKEKFVVGMVARFFSQKDWKTFIYTGISMTERYSDIVFICVGDGPLLEECKKIVPEKFTKKIIFTGNREDVESITNIFNIAVLLSSPAIGEGLSNSIMEYMSLGKPIIVNENGGNSELVNSSEVGIVIKDINPYRLEDEILKLRQNPVRMNLLGQNAKQRIISLFSYDKMILSYTQLYKNVIASE